MVKKIEPHQFPLEFMASILDEDEIHILPEKLLEIDLEDKLFSKIMPMASSVIISALVRNKARDLIINTIKPDHLGKLSLHRFLYKAILDQINLEGKVSITKITKRIQDHIKEYFNEEPSIGSLRAEYYNWAQMLKMDPTISQIKQAIDLRLIWFREKEKRGTRANNSL